MARPTDKEGEPLRLPDRASADDRGYRIGCVVSTYHHELVDEMRLSAFETLVAAGLDPDDFFEVRVPGAFELPLVAQRLVRRADIDAVLNFGLVLKGETEHDRYIASSVSDALISIGLANDKPVLFGVLTCSTIEQARARSRRAADGGLDKGREVARAAIGSLHALARASGSTHTMRGLGFG